MAQGDAYYCECGKEMLEQEREEQLKRGEAPKYSGRCRHKNLTAKEAQLIRFKVPAETVVFQDLIRGEISFDAGLMGDMAIAKNLRTPLYNFAVVVDDAEMKISHVIRGEDHIANTPKQILLQRALGLKTPIYAHLPLILDPDRSKMSKRYSATSIQEYKEQGYLPEALVNFMALLGWHPADDREKMPLSEIREKFDLKRTQKAGAVFDIQKLNWLNSEYLKEKSVKELFRLIQELYRDKITVSEETALKLLNLGKVRMATLKDFLALQESLNLPDYPPALLIWKNTPKEKILENLRKAQEILKGILEHEFSKKGLEKYLMAFANLEGRGEVLWPLRAALSGRDKSPGPFELMAVLGKEETLKRIEMAMKKLESGI